MSKNVEKEPTLLVLVHMTSVLFLCKVRAGDPVSVPNSAGSTLSIKQNAKSRSLRRGCPSGARDVGVHVHFVCPERVCPAWPVAGVKDDRRHWQVHGDGVRATQSGARLLSPMRKSSWELVSVEQVALAAYQKELHVEYPSACLALETALSSAREPRGVVIVAVDSLGAFFGTGSAGDLGRVRDAVMTL